MELRVERLELILQVLCESVIKRVIGATSLDIHNGSIFVCVRYTVSWLIKVLLINYVRKNVLVS
jgi:hypothetical protein